MVVNTQDSKGRFVKGHPPLSTLPGRNRGVRPKALTTKVKDALQIAQDAMPQLIQAMLKDARDPNISANVRQQCREYLIDRVYGKANQPISSDTPAITTFVFVQSDGTQITAKEALERAVSNQN